jgi:hypothetical protein
VDIGGTPGSSITFSPGFSVGSIVFLTGITPVVTRGAVVLSTRRCAGVPYRLTVSEYEPTNVRSSIQ